MSARYHEHAEFDQPTGPWTPPVWSKGPAQLVADAKLDLFQTRNAVEHGALMTSGTSMSGQQTAPANEAEKLIQSISPGDNTAATWLANLKDLRATEPLYGSGEGANPNA